MMRVGHYGAAMLAALPLLVAIGPGQRMVSILSVFGAVLGARLPDVDQRIPFVPHRGPTHTVWFALLVGLGTATTLHGVIPGVSDLGRTLGGAALATGVGSHLLADAITPAGVRPFWPLWNHRLSLGLVRAENGFANRIVFVVGMVAVLAVLGEIPLTQPGWHA